MGLDCKQMLMHSCLVNRDSAGADACVYVTYLAAPTHEIFLEVARAGNIQLDCITHASAVTLALPPLAHPMPAHEQGPCTPLADCQTRLCPRTRSHALPLFLSFALA
jgi:hypothetical protein